MKRVCSFLLCVLLLCALCVSVTAVNDGYRRVMDEANLLTDSQEASLLAKLDEISARHAFDVAVVTVDSTNGQSARDFADDYFDYNGYGYGDGRNGILLLVSYYDREWWMSTRGYGLVAFTDAGLRYMEDEFVYYLSEEDFVRAFDTYADLCDEMLTGAEAGSPYDSATLPKQPFNAGSRIVPSLIIGALIALVVTVILKGQLKSVRAKESAADYVRPGSLNITQSRDMFLYSTVSKVKRAEQSSGSSSHHSSSGASHGGHGGHF